MDYRPLQGPGGLESPSGGFVSLLCDQGLHFASKTVPGFLDVTKFLSLNVYLAAQ